MDDGCQEVLLYRIYAYIGNAWVVVGTSTSTTGEADLTSRKGQLTSLRVTAENLIGEGVPSDVIKLTSAALPSASELIEVTEYAANSLALSWSVPQDTGIGNRDL